jgi:hypothetical protein
MNYSGPYRHKLILAGSEENRAIAAILKDGKQVHFSSPLTKNKVPKIYVIKIDGEVVYIGFTSQSVTSRLNYGLKANGKNGYYGYQWRNKTDEVELLVFVFDKLLTGNKDLDKKDREFVEAIEAELVYQFRSQNGEWPKYQNEIHFNNSDRKGVLGITEYIYKYITE